MGERDGESDERDLVERARADPSAFAELYRRYLPARPRLRLPPDRRHRGRRGHHLGGLRARAAQPRTRSRWRPGGFGPWLFRIVVERARRPLPADRPRGLGSLDGCRTPPRRRPAPDPADEVGDRDAVAEVLAAMDRLSPRYQQALALRYLADLTADEAAAAMGTSKATLAVVVHRATRALRRALGRGGPVVSDDIASRLEDAGRRAVPPPDPAFADALEARLLAVAASRRPPPRRAAARSAAGRAAAAATRRLPASRSRPSRWSSCRARGSRAARPGRARARRSRSTSRSPSPTAPCSRTPTGCCLPEGAVIVVGEGGSRDRRQVLLPGDVATIDDGRLSVEHDQPIGVGPQTPDRPTPRPTPDGTPTAVAGPEPHAQADRAADPRAHAEADACPGSHARRHADARADADAHARRSSTTPTPTASPPPVPLTARPRSGRTRIGRRPGRVPLDRHVPGGQLRGDRDPLARRPRAGPRLSGLARLRRVRDGARPVAPVPGARSGRRGQGHGRGPGQARPRGVRGAGSRRSQPAARSPPRRRADPDPPPDDGGGPPPDPAPDRAVAAADPPGGPSV